MSRLAAAARAARRLRLERPLRTAAAFADRAFVAAGRPPLTANVDGVRLQGYLRHRGFLDHVRRGYEPYTRELLRELFTADATFVDVGAHIGLYSALACTSVRRVIAFEPDPYNVRALRRNLARRGCDNVTIVVKAASDRDARAVFRSFAGTVSGSLVSREGRYESIEVPTTTVDAELGDVTGPVVVKLDVEGAEPLALAGMPETLARPDVTLVVEVNPGALEAGGSSVEQLVALLRERGLECAYIDEERRALQPVNAPQALKKGNLLCRASGR